MLVSWGAKNHDVEQAFACDWELKCGEKKNVMDIRRLGTDNIG